MTLLQREVGGGTSIMQMSIGLSGCMKQHRHII